MADTRRRSSPSRSAYPTLHRGPEASGAWPEAVLGGGGAPSCGGTRRRGFGAARSEFGPDPRVSAASRASVGGGRGCAVNECCVGAQSRELA
ncbi:hypothetical protein NDU88_006200 [Pleurodeles waltl]|uniref:Uncharacterized protein n=1 Tax=Pleurodeles waltl TaxID=8319 RepID=A0AAV7VL87_PLEWA|nr:hypothetical protein NDU88_006200 [Pleurodeles waltl]